MMRAIFCKPAILIVAFLLSTAVGPASLAQSVPILVNSTADAVDAAPGDGQCRTAAGVCTLRAAVQEANAFAGADVITLAAATYTITIGGGDDAAANGDLDITSDVRIDGAGPNATIIDGNLVNRIFEIWNSSTQVTMSQLKLQNGQTQSGQFGGGIFNKGQTKLENVIITNNHAENGAGISSSGNLLVVGSTISGNQAVSFGGGGIYSNGTLTMNDSVVSDNRAAEDGGGIYHAGSMLTISGSAVRDNTAEDGSGGGIFSTGRVILTDSSISDNFAYTNGDGGGISNGDGELTISGSTISGNSTDGVGGGIRNSSATVTLRNSTISGNSAMQNAGGIYNDTGSVFSANSTFTSNTSSGTNGGLTNINGSLTLQNTLVAKNTGSFAPDCSGTLLSQGYNFIGNNAGCMPGATTGDQVGTSGNPLNPKLGPLQNNGGTTLTHAPLAGSPLIDAGHPGAVGQGDPTCEATDQVGTSRPQGSQCDIGAVEFTVSVPAPVLNSLAPAAAKAGSAGFLLSVQGANFSNGATVRWNGTARSTTFVSSSELSAAISASDIRRAGTASVTVANPAPLGGESSARGFTITPGPAYIPFLVRTVPPPCDAYGSNDNHKANPIGPIISGMLYRDKICSANDEDSYYFNTPTKTTVQIVLSIPPPLIQHLALGVYAQTSLDLPINSDGCYTDAVRSAQYTVSCSLPAGGRYIVRLYPTESAFDATNDYTLQVKY